MEVNLLNGLSLAYIGDAVYELMIRNHFLSLGYMKVRELHRKTVFYTSGNAQASAIHYFLAQNVLEDEEIAIFKRGRNSHVHTSRKNINLQEYLDATGFEALIGYLYLKKQTQRLEYLVNCILNKEKGESL